MNELKQDLRQTFKTQRLSMPPKDVNEKSSRICETLIRNYHEGPIVGYMPIQNEPDLSQFYAFCHHQKIPLYLPKYNAITQQYQLARYDHSTDLKKGHLGILEPQTDLVSVDQLPASTWLIPGLAFDHTGFRLGFGKGYYDQLLDSTPGTKIGIAYDWQIVPKLPVDQWDIPCDRLVTSECNE